MRGNGRSEYGIIGGMRFGQMPDGNAEKHETHRQDQHGPSSADGEARKFAYDYDGKRFEKHPTSGLSFLGLQHPGYGKMAETAKSIHAKILDFNLLSFDLVQRADGSICVVEINATSEGITQLQYDFGGLFGTYSEDVVNWCAAHKKNDSFAHLRTWYQ